MTTPEADASISSGGKQLLTAREAVAYLGYDSVDQFRRAVQRGIFPKPFDPYCKEQRWSRKQIDAYLSGNETSVLDRATLALEKRMGMA